MHIEYRQTDSMIADVFTKALGRMKLERFTKLLGIASKSGITLEGG